MLNFGFGGVSPLKTYYPSMPTLKKIQILPIASKHNSAMLKIEY